MDRSLQLLATLMFLSSARLYSAGAAEPDYTTQIKPLLQRKCFNCHGALQQKGDLRLDHPSFLVADRDSGIAVVAGKPDDSLLLSAVLGTDGVSRMPAEGEPLSDQEIDLLRQWIQSGAKMPEEPLPKDPRQHWAFQLPVRPSLPASADGQAVNPIDAFLNAELQQRGITPRPAADKATLLRRIYLDLIGIPPTRAELTEFLADTRSNAYEAVVDRLLASPQYGERWGRHWMDVWRYSDWDGYGAEIRESQAHIWRWRDWIVESLNADAPYDQMVRDMLAADELAPTDASRVRATGFLARNWFLFSRQGWLDSTIEHTGKAFLGLTFNCARCHDHMYDPLSQVEYYQLRAIFEPHDVRTDRLAGQPDTKQAGLVRVFDAKAETPTYLLHRGDEKQPEKDKPLPPLVPALWGTAGFDLKPVPLPPQVYYPGLQPFWREETLAVANQQLTTANKQLSDGQALVAAARQRLQSFRDAGGATSAQTVAVLADDFTQLDPSRWTSRSGNWQVIEGKIQQTTPGGTESLLVNSTKLPRDVAVRFRFTITGGEMWKSLGLSFDAVNPDNYVGVYLSATAGGPKAQLFLKQNGQISYPAPAAKNYAVETGKEYELYIAVRDKLVNVGVDGKLVFAYQLPHARAAENLLTVWTYDATGRFSNLTVEPLSAETRLVDKVEGEVAVPTNAPPSEESLQLAVTAAEHALPSLELNAKVAQQTVTVWQKRIAADDARYAQPVAANASELAQAAVRSERELAVLQAEVAQLAAARANTQAQSALKQDDQKSKAAAEAAQKSLTEADQKLAAARKSLEEPLTEHYTALSPIYPKESTGRRTALANWITDPGNPLTARVAVNHLWLRHFHKPLVPNVFDFGVNGQPPTHPALLDWLATELVAQGWKMKALHRLMVTSQAYQRASTLAGPDDPVLQLDPDNMWYSRANLRRMEAEIVRDSTLAVAGSLDLTAGGPDLEPAQGPTLPRRSLYFRNSKEKKDLFLSLFDSPNVVECYRRPETVVPQQALAMSNSPLTLAQARKLAGQLTQEVGAEPANNPLFITQTFLILMSRAPTEREMVVCSQFLETQGQRLADNKSLTAFTAATTAAIPPAADPRQRARENLIHVLLNHNDFVTIR